MPVSTISFAQAVRQSQPAQSSPQRSVIASSQAQSLSTTTPTSRTQAQTPRSTSPTPTEEEQYVLTLLTTPAHHKAMTSLRTKYFPPHLNKLDAHVTLFHALPETQLDTFIADIEDVTRNARPVEIEVSEQDVFRMRKGVGIYVNEHPLGASSVKAIHAALRDKWTPFLSDQDRRELKPHYTVANKINYSEDVDGVMTGVVNALERMAVADANATTTSLTSTVNGLTLYAYNRGRWKFYRDFRFGAMTENR
jgi:mannose-1-phosphate guanylyltransferase